jgi:ABC-type branched-subunit amino acid transport system substrate-binding protein
MMGETTMIRRRSSWFAFAAAAALLVGACGGDDSGDDDGDGDTTTVAAATTVGDTTAAPDTTAGTDTTTAQTTAPADTTAAPDTTTAEPAGWTVSTDECADPDAATAPIEGTISIGSVMPLSNSPAAAAFAPVKQGLDAYIAYANENQLVPGYTLQLNVQDDQYNADLTPNAVSTLIDSDVDLFTGIIGTPNNLAVRDTLNAECLPQLNNLTGAREWGDDIEAYPWTTGGLIPYFIESEAYLNQMQADHPDGATVGIFTVASDFGDQYLEAFKEGVEDAGLEIVSEQTIEPTDTNPPTSQVGAIAGEQPDIIMAVPLGAQCGQFTSEVQSAKAQNPGWEPQIYLTNTCASSLILALAGESANGIFTSASGGILDVGNPTVVEANPAAKTYADFMTAGGYGDYTTAAAGWVIGEATIETLKQAAASEAGLTRASIMEAARNMNFSPELVREGVTYSMNGDEDTYMVTDVQVVQYDAVAKIFNDIGTLHTDLDED